MTSYASVPIDQLLAHREWVRRVARAMVRDENDADDLEQGLWLEALRRPPRSGRSVRGWFFTALRRDWTDVRRSEDCRTRREEATARAEASSSAVDLVAKADALKRVVVAVMDLAEPYRSTILYRYFEGLPPSVIAARLGCPVETVRTRLKRAVALLRERLDADDDGERSAWLAALLPAARRDLPRAPECPSVAASAAGVVLMGVKTKVAAAVLVLLLLVVGVLQSHPAGDAGRDSVPVQAEEARGRRSPAERPRARQALHSASSEATPPATGTTGAAPRGAGTEAPAPTTVAGRVLEAGGEPAAGVAVVLIPQSDVRSEYACSTDATGRFELRGIASGACRVEARPAARAPIAHDLVLPRDGAPAEVELRLAPARLLTVVVVDEASNPVRGAPVAVRHDWAGSVSGTTDDAGHWATRLDGTGSLTVGTKDLPGLAQPAPIAIASDAETVRVVLRDAATATGTVLDPDGRPIAGAYVDVMLGGAKSRTVVSDTSGAFRVDVPLYETVDLVLVGKSFVDGQIRRLPFEGRADGVRGGDRGVVLRAALESTDASIEVLVLSPARTPVQGARAWLAGPLGEVHASSHTDARGRARLGGLPTRGLRLWVDTSTLPRDSRFALWGPREVRPAGQAVEVQLMVAVVISGTVTDVAGDPVKGIAVSALRGERQVAIAFAAEDGTFELALPPDLTGSVTVRAKRRRTDGHWSVSERSDVKPGTAEVRLELPAQ